MHWNSENEHYGLEKTSGILTLENVSKVINARPA